MASRASSSPGARRGERRRPGRDAARLELGAPLLEPGRRGPKLRRVCHEPGENQHPGRVPHEGLGHREERLDPRPVRDGDEDRALRGLRDGDRCRCLDVERRVLPKDRLLQLLQGRARVDSELVDERAARVLVGLESFRLAARAVQGRDETYPQALAERVLCNERLELADQLVVAGQREVGVDPQLDRGHPDFLEPGNGGLGEALVDEVRERRTSPQRQRVAQPLRRVGREPAGEHAPALVDQPLEALEVELVRSDADQVAGRPRLQHVLRKRLAEPRDVDAQSRGRVVGRALAPELVDQPVGWDDLVGVEEQHGEQLTRLRPAQGYLAAFIPNLERSQDPELHVPASRRGTLPPCCSAETDLKRAQRSLGAPEHGVRSTSGRE